MIGKQLPGPRPYPAHVPVEEKSRPGRRFYKKNGPAGPLKGKKKEKGKKKREHLELQYGVSSYGTLSIIKFELPGPRVPTTATDR